MKLEGLTEEQTKLIQELAEIQNTGKYRPEFISYVNLRGCYVRISSIISKDEEHTLQVNETDILHLAETGYITLIKTLEHRPGRSLHTIGDRANYKLSLKPKAFGQNTSLSENPTNAESPKVRTTDAPLFFSNVYVDISRIEELRTISSKKFNLAKLIKLCEELNDCYNHESYFAVAALTRALVDHIPPVFGYKTFTEVANNYSAGGRSFRESMQHLDVSSRKIADAHLHSRVRNKEILPNRTQINFSNDIDVLLGEVIRTLT